MFFERLSISMKLSYEFEIMLQLRLDKFQKTDLLEINYFNVFNFNWGQEEEVFEQIRISSKIALN